MPIGTQVILWLRRPALAAAALLLRSRPVARPPVAERPRPSLPFFRRVRGENSLPCGLRARRRPARIVRLCFVGRWWDAQVIPRLTAMGTRAEICDRGPAGSDAQARRETQTHHRTCQIFFASAFGFLRMQKAESALQRGLEKGKGVRGRGKNLPKRFFPLPRLPHRLYSSDWASTSTKNSTPFGGVRCNARTRSARRMSFNPSPRRTAI